MSIDVHGITYDTVLSQVGGVDTTQIKAGNASNLPLSDITDWIEDGAGIMDGVYASIGATVASPASIKTWKTGVIAFAKARIYERLNRMDAAANAMVEHRDAKKDARAYPSETGGVIIETGVSSNVDPSDPFEKKFTSRRSGSSDRGFRGW